MCVEENQEQQTPEEIPEQACAPWVSVKKHGGDLQGGFSFGVDWAGGCGEMELSVTVVAIKKHSGGATTIYSGPWPGLPEHACTFQIPEPKSLYYMISCYARVECMNTGKIAHDSEHYHF